MSLFGKGKGAKDDREVTAAQVEEELIEAAIRERFGDTPSGGPVPGSGIIGRLSQRTLSRISPDQLDVTNAETRVHWALMRRALKWLELLDEEGLDEETGRPKTDLSTQVQMFKVISDWLQVSRKTKPDEGDKMDPKGVEVLRNVLTGHVMDEKLYQFMEKNGVLMVPERGTRGKGRISKRAKELGARSTAVLEEVIQTGPVLQPKGKRVKGQGHPTMTTPPRRPLVDPGNDDSGLAALLKKAQAVED